MTSDNECSWCGVDWKEHDKYTKVRHLEFYVEKLLDKSKQH